MSLLTRSVLNAVAHGETGQNQPNTNMKNGTFSPIEYTADGALAGIVLLSTFKNVPPSGKISEMAVKTIRALDANISTLTVLDFGLNRMAVMKHSAANEAAVLAVLDALDAQKFTFTPGVTNATSADWTVQREAGTQVLDSVAAAAGVTGDFEPAIRAALNPSPSSKTAAGIIDAIETGLTAAQLEGFLLLNSQDQSFELYVLADTSVEGSFSSKVAIEAIPDIEAGAFVVVANMIPDTVTAAPKTII